MPKIIRKDITTHTFTARIYDRHGFTPIGGEIHNAEGLAQALAHAAELLQGTDIPGHRLQIIVTARPAKKTKP